MHIREAVVVAKVCDFVNPGPFLLPRAMVHADAVVSKLLHFSGQGAVVGRDHATFTGGNGFDGMKAKYVQVSQAAYRLILVGGAK